MPHVNKNVTESIRKAAMQKMEIRIAVVTKRLVASSLTIPDSL